MKLKFLRLKVIWPALGKSSSPTKCVLTMRLRPCLELHDAMDVRLSMDPLYALQEDS
jgi:hypothetical protein